MACCVLFAGVAMLIIATWRRCCGQTKSDMSQALRWRLETKNEK